MILDAINVIKNGYLGVAGWVDEHPHASLWIALAVLVVALVL